MRKWIVSGVAFLSLTGLACAEPDVASKVLMATLAANGRVKRLRPLVQANPAMAAELSKQLQSQHPKDYHKQMERQIILNTLARLLPDPALQRSLKSQGLWVDDPRWGGPNEGMAVVDLGRTVSYRREQALADQLTDQGAYKEASERNKVALHDHPFNDSTAVLQSARRRGALEHLLDSQSVGEKNLILVKTMVDTLAELPADNPMAADSSFSAYLELVRSAEEAGMPLSARDAYLKMDAAAQKLNLAFTPMIRFIVGSHLQHIEWQRNSNASSNVQSEFQRVGAWLDQMPAQDMDAYWAARVGESLVVWRTMVAPGSDAWYETKLKQWHKKFGRQQLSYALLRSRIVAAGQLRRQGQTAAAQAALAAVEKSLATTPVELPDWPAVLGHPVVSQEVSQLTSELLREKARVLGNQDLHALFLYRGALQYAYRPRDIVDLLNEEAPLVRRFEEGNFEAENKRARDQADHLSHRLGLLNAYSELGLYQADQNRPEEATKSLGLAIQLFEKYLGDLDPGPERKESLRSRLKEVYDRYTELKLKQGDGQAAFQALVQSDQLQRNLAAPTLRSQDPKRQQKLEQVQRSKEEAAGAATSNAAPALLAKTKSEFFSVVRTLRSDGKNYGGLLAVQPVEFAQLQQQLPEDTVLVQYYPTASTLYFFVVSRQGFKVRSLALSKEELYKKVMSFRGLCTSQANSAATFDWQSAGGRELLAGLSGLNDVLIQPVREDLQGHKVLAVVPTETLLYLPFPALAQVQGGKPHFLVEDLAVVTLLRATDLARLSKSNSTQGALLAFGNPDGTLKGAQKEVEELGKSFPQADVAVQGQATSARLQAAQPPRLLHLATHAILDRQQPNNSYLVMAGSGEAGKLTVPQIFDLPLAQTRLVTLSACQTELGEREPGAAVSSLAEAFWVAGSPSLVASLWSVEDESTGRLMIDFYKQLQGGSPLGLALQHAQLGLLKERKTGHPFFWAPFVLIGDWQ